VTRSYPVGGVFAGAARDVYQAVLDAQDAVFAAIVPGVTIPQMHQAALRPLVVGLVALGALSGDVDELIATEAYKPFYMHTTGHLLGLDVHDVGNYFVDGKPRVLPGMCFTSSRPALRRDRAERPRLRGIGVHRGRRRPHFGG
jgi:Xaa-Pro aminopeptidase